MDTTIVELFKHNRWANLRLLEACHVCSDEQLDASVVGTFGSMRQTLVHLLAAEERYVSLLGGPQPERPLRESEGFPGGHVMTILTQQGLEPPDLSGWAFGDATGAIE
jgi:hypothetical protein